MRSLAQVQGQLLEGVEPQVLVVQIELAALLEDEVGLGMDAVVQEPGQLDVREVVLEA